MLSRSRRYAGRPVGEGLGLRRSPAEDMPARRKSDAQRQTLRSAPLTARAANTGSPQAAARQR
jgi:hypothetical protein